MCIVSARTALIVAVTAVSTAIGVAVTPLHAQSATIHRDAWGSPHVVSATDAGVVFGMAWALAEDDWPLIEENYLHALGRYAELAGEAGVADDWMARALDIEALSVREYRASSPRMRSLLDAYASGLNSWLQTQPSGTARVLTRIEPWYPLAILRYKYYQTEFLGYAGLRGAWAKRLMDNGLPLPAATDEPRYYEAQFSPLGFRPRGSNQWALARTRDGHPMLLINPHQSFVGVQRYAEIHLDSDEGLRFAGLTVFGFLLPYMGHNGRLGWAYTDNYADHSDLYAETFDDPRRPLAYRYGDTHRMATVRTDSIRVRVGDRFETREFRFWKTHHGPIVGIADDGRVVAAKLSRLEEGGWFAQWDAMIRARDMTQWKHAVSQLRVAYMNTMYADADGNIGYIYNSAVPRRNAGVRSAGIVDGSDPTTEWQGYHTLDELPQVFNPASGWLMNTNSTPFTATTGVAFKRSDFPAYMVGFESDNARAQSSRRILEGMNGVTFDEFSTRVWDTRLGAADSVIAALTREWNATADAPSPGGGVTAGTTLSRADVERAVRRLQAWNRYADTTSVETTWFVLMYEQRMTNARAGSTTSTPWTDALAMTMQSLQTTYATPAVAWGTVNRHQRPLPGRPSVYDRSRPSVAVGGAPGEFGSVFTFYTAQAGGVSPRIGLGGNSFVMVVEFAPAVRARSILNYGQSGNPASDHYFDQAARYARQAFKPARFAREEVVANALRSYTVQPRAR